MATASRLLLAAFVPLLMVCLRVADAQETKPEIRRVPARYTSPSSGSKMFAAYCVACHGTNGKGDGAAAFALKVAPANLTTLAKRNNGTFLSAYVSKTIQGDADASAHGFKEMPVWGPVFLSMTNRNEYEMQLRIYNLTRYVESLQEK